MPQLKSRVGSRRSLLLGAAALATLTLLGSAHWFALAVSRDAGGAVVRRYVDVNMDDIPFGTGACPARDPKAISAFIDDTRDELKGALVAAWWSPLAGVELYIGHIDGVAGEHSVPGGSGWRQAEAVVSLPRAGRDIAIAYSVVVAPNGLTHGVFGLLFLAGATLLWRWIPGGLTEGQALWFRALVDAGEPRRAALARAEVLPEEDRCATGRGGAFDVLVGKRMYPPTVALEAVWGASANRLQDAGWEWATRLLGQDEAPAQEVFGAVAEAKPSAATQPRQVFERLVSSPIAASPLAAFRLVFGPDARNLNEDGWQWVDFALENLTSARREADSPLDLPRLWENAIGIAKAPVSVELNMGADPPYLAVKGVRLNGFEQRGTLIYYGQYLWRRLNGDGWLQNPQARARHPELRDELLELFVRWDAPETMKPVLDEGKHLADRLNNARGQIRSAFGAAFGRWQTVLTTFQFEEESRGKLTAYRVKLDPAQIVIREVEQT